MKKIKLGDVCTINAATYSDSDSYDFVNYLDTGNITANHIENIQQIDITQETLPSRARRKVKFNSIIYSTVRPNQRHYGIIKSLPENFLVSTGFAIIDADPEKIDANFLYYQMSRDEVVNNLQSIADQSTTAYPSIRPSDLSNLEFYVPSLETQRKIGNFLWALDDKIALNKKINATLEAMAKTLYDYWFVQFDFPDKHSKPYKTSGGKMVYSSELGRDIPAGWKVGTLEDFATYATKKISSEKIPRNRYIATDNMLPNAQGVTVSQYEPSESSVHEFTSGDVLLANIRPHFKKVWLAHFSGGCSSDVLVIRPKNFSEAEYIFSTLSRDDFFSYDVAGAKGTKMPRGDKVHIMSYPMLINNDLIERYVAFVRPMYFKLCKLHLESRRLAALRDWLLPMLMNGQVDFKKGEN